jgi:putative N-acetyltransferase (TIGR04045 family)
MPSLHYAFDDQEFAEFRSHHIQVKVASTSWEKQRYFALRRQVFAHEQQLLPDNEQDGQDFIAIPIIALAASWSIGDDVVGAVRIFEQKSDAADTGEHIWFGGRLCVAKAYRRSQSIGKSLINEAVSRAKDHGCTTFLANIQVQNEPYFQALHWQTLGEITVAGQPHVRMQADLDCYPFMPRHC